MIKVTLEQRLVLQNAVHKFGSKDQIDICIEECAELIQALSKFKRGKQHNVEEEVADVFIMLNQMLFVFDEFEAQKQIDFKINRLKEKL